MSATVHYLCNAIERINNALGKALCWLAGIMAIAVFLIVTIREVFEFSAMDINLGVVSFTLTFIALQESVTYMHAGLFMLCMAYTAQQGGHVRVDILYRRRTDLGRAWTDAIGATVFLLPFSVFLVVVSWNFVLKSWAIYEGSINPGGIPAVFILKSLIPAAGVLLTLRALAEIASNLMRITFVDPNPKYPS